jgi:hypothetical protein
MASIEKINYVFSVSSSPRTMMIVLLFILVNLPKSKGFLQHVPRTPVSRIGALALSSEKVRLELSSYDFSMEYPNDGDDDDEEEEEEIMSGTSDCESDWVQAELTLVGAPDKPHPDLDAFETATLIVRSLQFVDYPSQSSGLERCYDFFTLDCRAAVTARQGARSVERFVEYGQLAPALQPFMGATKVELGEATLTDASPPLRGALCSFPVTIVGAPILALQYPSGMTKGGVSQSPPITNMVLRLEQQRRPPYQGSWLVREILDVRMAFAGDMGNTHVGG